MTIVPSDNPHAVGSVFNAEILIPDVFTNSTVSFPEHPPSMTDKL